MHANIRRLCVHIGKACTRNVLSFCIDNEAYRRIFAKKKNARIFGPLVAFNFKIYEYYIAKRKVMHRIILRRRRTFAPRIHTFSQQLKKDSYNA